MNENWICPFFSRQELSLLVCLLRWVYPTTMAWHQVSMVCWFLRCRQQSCFVACQAERDPACQKILRQRMAEGLLHKSRLVADVTKFQGGDDPDAEGCAGGFPCQVQASIECLKCTAFRILFFKRAMLPAQDTSTAGLMCGMTGERSSMVKEIFRIYDGLRNPRKYFSQR